MISGPNLERLGVREPEVYGTTTLAQIHEQLALVASELGVQVVCRQSNHEGSLVDWINSAREDGFSGLLLNPGALTHTSYVLMDSLKGSELPAVEVHVSNPDAREAFRRRSRVAPACIGRVTGFGAESYTLALRGLVAHLRRSRVG